MDIIDKIFTKLQKQQAPGRLKAQILTIPDVATVKKTRHWFGAGLFKVALPVLMLLVIAGGVYYQYFRLANIAAAFELTAESRDEFGVLPNSSFILKSSARLSNYQIRKAVQFEPEVEYDIDSIGNNQYRLTPKGELASYQILKIKIDQGVADHDYSWAYQVKAPFQVISTIPGNHAGQVPINTGIEITFNREKLVSPEKFVSISPEIPGTFEQRGSVLIFKPKGDLKKTTVYSVTIKKGMTLDGSSDTLEKDYTFAFETSDPDGTAANPVNIVNDFAESPEGKPVLISYSNPSDVKISVYKCADSNGFIDSYKNSRVWEYGWSYYNKRATEVKLDQCKAAKQFDFVATWQQRQNEFGSEYGFYTEIPQSLKSGQYILDVFQDKIGHSYQWLQVTPLAHYASFMPQNGLIWLQDGSKRAAVADATISIPDGETVKTNSDGLAQFPTPQSWLGNTTSYSLDREYQVPRIVKVERSGYQPYFIQVIDNYGYNNYIAPDSKYWSTLSTDRPLYKLTDTLHYWGTAKLRDSDKSIKDKEVTLKLYEGYGYNFNNEVRIYRTDKPLIQTKAKVNDDGTFTGDISFSGLAASYYTVYAMVGDEVISSSSFAAAAYAKPSFTFEVKPDKQAYFTDDKIRFTVNAKYYDGTPVGNMPFSYTGYYGPGVNGSVTTDSSGIAHIVFDLPKIPDNGPFDQGSVFSQGFSLNVSPLGAQEGVSTQSAYVSLFNSRLSMNFDPKASVQNGSFAIELYNVDLNKTEPNEDLPAYLSSPAANHPVTVYLRKVSYVQRQTGEEYDYINKVTYPIYTYDQKIEDLETITQNTDSKGKLKVTKSYPKEDNVHYEISFEAREGNARPERLITSFSPNAIFSSPPPANSAAPAQEVKVIDWQPELHLNQQPEQGYGINDPVRLEVGFNNQSAKLPQNGPKVLFYSYQRSVLNAIVSGTKTEDTFKKEYRPGVQYRAVVFGPNGFEETFSVYANYKTDDAKLKISMETDKDQYRPGDEVKLKVHVKDIKDNGHSASVNVAVVDEAIFKIANDIDRGTLEDLYRDVTLSPLVTYTRYTGPTGGDGGKGGGGPGGLRADFKDTALWKNISVGSSGDAELSFKLPDNLTEWRVTTRAYSHDSLFAGSEKKAITTSLPLFIDPAISDTYLVGDEPGVVLRFNGKEYQNGQTVAVEAKSDTLKLSFKKEVQQNQIVVPLGKLTEGRHKIQFSIQQGKNKDALEKEIKVIPSYFQIAQTKTYELTNGLSGLAAAENTPTDYLVTDRGLGQFLPVLYGLNYGGGNRLDQRLTAFRAQQLLHDKFNAGDKPEGFDAGVFLKEFNTQQTGFVNETYYGLSLITYGDPDLEASAFAAQLYPDVLPREKLVKFFNYNLRNEKADLHRTVYSLFGLAAYNEPVLAKLQALASDEKLSVDDRMIVLLGIARMGDTETARVEYKKSIAPLIVHDGNQAYIKDAAATLQTRRTSRALALATKIGEQEDSKAFWQYAQSHWPEKDLDSFERLMAIEHELAKKPAVKGKFHYTTNRSNETITLNFGDTYYMRLLPDEAKSLRFDGVEGELSVTSQFAAYQDPATIVQNSNVKVDRAYLSNGKAVTQLDANAIIQVSVTIQPDKTLGNVFQVTDSLPSGLRPFANTYSYGFYEGYEADPCNRANWYADYIENNRISFTVYRPDYCGTKSLTVTYYARVVSVGNFRAEPVLVKSLYTDKPSTTLSKPSTIIIK